MKKVILSAIVAGFFASCSVTAPVNATSNAVGSKVGIAKTNQIIGLFFDGGDASIKTAAKNGSISKISTVDFKRSVFLFGLFNTYETIITGE